MRPNKEHFKNVFSTYTNPSLPADFMERLGLWEGADDTWDALYHDWRTNHFYYLVDGTFVYPTQGGEFMSMDEQEVLTYMLNERFPNQEEADLSFITGEGTITAKQAKFLIDYKVDGLSDTVQDQVMRFAFGDQFIDDANAGKVEKWKA